MSLNKPDAILTSLVSGIDRSDGDGDLGITVLVGGLIITGIAVSGRKYLTDLGSTFSSVLGGVEAVEARFIELAYKNYPEADVPEEHSDSHTGSYLHLKNVKFIHPELTIASQFPYLRIGLGSIQGWILGEAKFENK